ncbi:hypothetical protein K3723_07530 [Leisingera caerulea]|uniref:hypothetical protein n=1 Tax=Leisingera caerulea TaxID=506591 RepID=UPI0021A4929B|nr:hypothetical protein [Leisingera caerulea]UWQ64133.1 hypothetical protein K3723_07530 [Leisingera caerulea]
MNNMENGMIERPVTREEFDNICEAVRSLNDTVGTISDTISVINNVLSSQIEAHRMAFALFAEHVGAE